MTDRSPRPTEESLQMGVLMEAAGIEPACGFSPNVVIYRGFEIDTSKPCRAGELYPTDDLALTMKYIGEKKSEMCGKTPGCERCGEFARGAKEGDLSDSG